MMNIEATSGILHESRDRRAAYPVAVQFAPVATQRNRLTAAFRPVLAIPHLILVGGPTAFVATHWWWADHESGFDAGAGLGALGAAACAVTVIVWFAIVFGGRHPRGLWKLAAYYLRWRVRAMAYLMLLRDEYPPFGDGDYPVYLRLTEAPQSRDRVRVALRPLLAVPHFLVLWLLGFAWAVSTAVAWISILVTGTYPSKLYEFGVGVLRWGVRVEAYVLLLRDEYPPFSLGSTD